jgi:hypothetical protein
MYQYHTTPLVAGEDLTKEFIKIELFKIGLKVAVAI